MMIVYVLSIMIMFPMIMIVAVIVMIMVIMMTIIMNMFNLRLIQDLKCFHINSAKVNRVRFYLIL